MKYLITLLIISFNLQAQVVFSQNPNEFSTKKIEKLKPPILTSFEQSAQWADLVAIAQVDDIEYEQTRNRNTKGYAFLTIHVAYKGAIRGETIAVLATGTDDNTCYYPDRVNEGERFLVFLKKAPNELKNVYYGFKPYCQMQILLSDIGQYILRTPLDAKNFDLDESLSQKQTFNDPHAIFDTTFWTGIKREAYSQQFKCSIIESEDALNKIYHLRYTQGIPIYNIRPLLKIKKPPRITSKQI